MGDEDLVDQRDIISLICTILRGIDCKIDVGGAKKRTLKYKSNYESSSESKGGRDDDGGGGGRVGHGKENMCCIPGHNHA